MIRPMAARPFAQVIPLQSPNVNTPSIETPPVTAIHGGRCMPPGCRGVIRKGEPIQRVDGRWMHEECVPHNGTEVWHDQEEAA